MMIMNILMLLNVAGFLPRSRHHALLCSSGISGYSSFMRLLTSSTMVSTRSYPAAHSILITNVDIHELGNSRTDDGNEEDDLIHEVAAVGCAEDDPSFVVEATNTPPAPHRPHSFIFSTLEAKSYLRIQEAVSSSDIQFTSIVSNVKRLPYRFLAGCTFLTHIDITALQNVVELPDGFLAGCTALQSINFTGLDNVRKLPRNFLQHCSSLKVIVFSGLHQVKCLPEGFLMGCTSLRHISLSGFDQVGRLPHAFLRGYSWLESVHFGGLGGHRAWMQQQHPIDLPYDLLAGCTNLTSVDFSDGFGDKISTTLPAGFLDGCCNLISIDLSPLKGISEIPHNFLRGCCGLTSIILGSGFHDVTEIPSGFLSGCSSLLQIDFTSMCNVMVLPFAFLGGCSGLQEINFTGLSNVTELPTKFLVGCSGLTTLDFTPLSGVLRLNLDFLEGCSGLRYLSLNGLNKVSTIPLGFLADCQGLQCVDISALRGQVRKKKGTRRKDDVHTTSYVSLNNFRTNEI